MVQELVSGRSYTDTTLVCNDGQLLHNRYERNSFADNIRISILINRLTVWLLLPALGHCPAFLQEDESFVVLLPDFSVSEVKF